MCDDVGVDEAGDDDEDSGTMTVMMRRRMIIRGGDVGKGVIDEIGDDEDINAMTVTVVGGMKVMILALMRLMMKMSMS